MMSITADATFVVVLVFIACLLDLVMRRIVVRDEHDVYNRCASGSGVRRVRICGFSGLSLSPLVDNSGWSNGKVKVLIPALLSGFYYRLYLVAKS